MSSSHAAVHLEVGTASASGLGASQGGDVSCRDGRCARAVSGAGIPLHDRRDVLARTAGRRHGQGVLTTGREGEMEGVGGAWFCATLQKMSGERAAGGKKWVVTREGARRQTDGFGL